MSISLKGDFAKLASLQSRLSAIADQKRRDELAKVVGAEALKLVQMGFRDSVDPFGAAWAPLKHRAGKPLLDTGRLRSSFSMQPRSSGFEIGTNAVYAKFHQYGTGGRKKTSTHRRFTDRGGRFMSDEKGKRRAKKSAASFRFVTFKAGGGAIPARKMIPDSGRLGSQWRDAFKKTADRFFARLMRK